FGTIPMPKGALDAPDASASDSAGLPVKLDLPPSRSVGPAQAAPSEPPPPRPEDGTTPGAPKLKVSLDLPPSKGITPTLPSFSQEKEGPAPGQPAKPAFFGKTAPSPFRPPTRSGERPHFEEP